MRISIPNKDNELKVGMTAFITVKKEGEKGIFLPPDAVLRDGKMAMVWLQTSQNKFKSVMVEAGMESGDMIEIKSGIQENDMVVNIGCLSFAKRIYFQKMC